MGMLSSGNFVAYGVIQPSRFVKLDTGAGHLRGVIQASGNDSTIIGISQEGSEDPPGVLGSQPDAARGGNLAAPATPTTGTTAGGSLTGQGTYYVKITYLTPYGETTASAEASQAVADNNLLTVTAPTAVAGATGWNVYVSQSTGTETLQNSTPLGIGQNYTMATTGIVTGVVPPTTNTSGFPPTTSTLKVYGLGEICLLKIGAGGCTAGDSLAPDANGQGITVASASTAKYFGAKALETANAGEFALVQVVLGSLTAT